jgi:PmbA protein
MSQSASPRGAATDVRAELSRLVEEVAERAIAAGAHAAEAVVGSGSRLHVKVRAGQPELITEAQSKSLGLRVLRDHCSALTYTSDFSAEGLRVFIENAVAMCRLSEPDPLNELPGRDELVPKGTALPDLGLWDDRTPTLDADYAMAQARACEAAALAVSDKLRPDHGASFSRHTGQSAFACADPGGVLFVGATRGTSQYLAVSVLCDDRDGKKRSGSQYTSNRFVAGLSSPEEVGKTAGQRALAKLGAEKIATCELPVIFEPEEAQSLLGQLAQLVSGGAIYRKQSYLTDHEGQLIASPLCNIVDDPLIPGAAGSRPFDGEGLLARRNVIVENGVLRTYLLDTYSARKLGRKSNGCAGRSGAGSPHVTTSNFILSPGDVPPEALYRDLPRALYVTEMMGFGFNPVTGDFSRGASGFLIENGVRTQPVSEVTISANFDDLLKRIDGLGNDLDRRGSVMAPTLRVSRMTVAGR